MLGSCSYSSTKPIKRAASRSFDVSSSVALFIFPSTACVLPGRVILYQPRTSSFVFSFVFSGITLSNSFTLNCLFFLFILCTPTFVGLASSLIFVRRDFFTFIKISFEANSVSTSWLTKLGSGTSFVSSGAKGVVARGITVRKTIVPMIGHISFLAYGGFTDRR